MSNIAEVRHSSPLPDDHPAIPEARVGLLLINLGTPDGNDTASVRRYLREFLTDRRVIEVNPWLWRAILETVVLPFRSAKAAHAYRAIWDTERNESPLRVHTRAIAEGLAGRLGARGVMVDWAMRYGSPAIRDPLEALRAAGCQRILLFALYPQYSATTTATAYDKSFAALGAMRWQPAVRAAPPYHDDAGYIAALKASVDRHLETLGWEPERLLLSFHGLPKRYFLAGDPYHCHCQKTARLLTEALGWADGRVVTAFQSRFGREEWLRPYADQTVADLARDGVKRLAVISPGFAADCVETLEELDMGLRQTFLGGGGARFSYIPCLNAGADGVAMLEALAVREMGGWV